MLRAIGICRVKHHFNLHSISDDHSSFGANSSIQIKIEGTVTRGHHVRPVRIGWLSVDSNQNRQGFAPARFESGSLGCQDLDVWIDPAYLYLPLEYHATTP